MSARHCIYGSECDGPGDCCCGCLSCASAKDNEPPAEIARLRAELSTLRTLTETQARELAEAKAKLAIASEALETVRIKAPTEFLVVVSGEALRKIRDIDAKAAALTAEKKI